MLILFTIVNTLFQDGFSKQIIPSVNYGYVYKTVMQLLEDEIKWFDYRLEATRNWSKSEMIFRL